MKVTVALDTSLVCPACGAPTTIRTSRKLSELSREEYIDCSNECCPGRFRVVREIVASLYEGSYAHGLKLPQSLRKQAIGSAPRLPDPNQLELPGLDLSCYGGAPPPGAPPG